ncbi:hypothetical protein [uncultured Aliiroseovarius sp.]|uniref:acylneuraminate cytidylyltransferase family protein n=1 Tax=uncultured Aliiroseovarius sp. TaxID=1658783 RepID=UPI002627A491|nr:hypothetical protein [uncultured Aliiroseovarius sp.]
MIVGLLTGRGGSVSIPDKNVIEVLGRPLMSYAALMANQSKLIDEVYLSTDGEKLKDVGREMGLKIIDRPEELALPTSQHKDALAHALSVLEAEGKKPEILVVFLCNVGTHRPGLVDHCIQQLIDNPELDSVVTVEERNEYHPLRTKKAGPDGNLVPFLETEGPISTNRQDLEPALFIDHTFWVLRVSSCFGPEAQGQQPWDFMGQRIKGVPNSGSIDIHTHEDIAYTEAWLRKYGWTSDETPSGDDI